MTKRSKLISWTALLSFIGASWAAWALSSQGGLASAVGPSGRTGIDVCVAIAPELRGEVHQGKAQQSVKLAMDQVATAPAGKALGLDGVRRSVVAACPHGYVDPPANVGRNSKQPSLRGRVDQASHVSTLVFVVGGAEAASLGPSGFGRVAYESMCDGEVCMEVTTAVFVSAEVLGTPDALKVAMTVGLGIDPTAGRYPNGHPPEANGSRK